MKKLFQIILIVSGAIFAVSACILGGMYATKLVRRLKNTYDTLSNCFRPIDYVVDEDED